MAGSAASPRFDPQAAAPLVLAAALVNTDLNGDDRLIEPGDLAAVLDARGYPGYRAGSTDELADLQALRRPLHRFWRARNDAMAAQLANTVLRHASARPQLIADNIGWRLALTADSDPLGDRIAADAAMAVIDLIRSGERDRLRTCAAPDCQAVLVDLSRNRSRRFCDTGNCANRQHAAAYRARRSGS